NRRRAAFSTTSGSFWKFFPVVSVMKTLRALNIQNNSLVVSLMLAQRAAAMPDVRYAMDTALPLPWADLWMAFQAEGAGAAPRHKMPALPLPVA
ncbi:MAG: hypothetical protein NXI32_27905, partial [bacterium]|nr:hypothetical protein [bacterium]